MKKLLAYSFLLAFSLMTTVRSNAQNSGISAQEEPGVTVNGAAGSQANYIPKIISNDGKLITIGNSSLYNLNGKIGIGTTQPSSPLHVKTDGGVISLFEDTDIGGFIQIETDYLGNSQDITGKAGSGNHKHMIGVTDQSDVQIANGRLTIINNGNVGVGLTNPQKTLDVGGHLGLKSSMSIKNSTNQELFIEFDNSNKAILENEPFESGFEVDYNFHIKTGGDKRLTVLENGNVGVGTEAPSQALEVNGNIIAVGGDISAQGTIEGTHFNLIDGVDAILDISTTNSTLHKKSIINLRGNSNNTLGNTLGEINFMDLSEQNSLYKCASIQAKRYGAQNASLHFKAAEQGSDLMVILPVGSGRVGIGKTNPAEALDVNGNVKATKFIGDGSELTNLNIPSFWQATQNPNEISYTGKAIVNGDFEVENNYMRLDNGATYLELSMDGLKYSIQDEYSETGFETENYAFHIKTDSHRKLTVLGNGNVGIGTENPEVKLDIDGYLKVRNYASVSSDEGNSMLEIKTTDTENHRSPMLRIIGNSLNHANYNIGGIQFLDISQTQGAIQAGIRAKLYNSDCASIEFYSKLEDGAIMAITPKEGGCVGIGTSAPAQKLDVNGKIKADALVLADGTEIDGTSLHLQGKLEELSPSIKLTYFENNPKSVAYSHTIQNTGGSLNFKNSNDETYFTFFSSGKAIAKKEFTADSFSFISGAKIISNGNDVAFMEGNVGIGTQDCFTYTLAVNGTIGCKEVNIETTSAWPDYVFEEEYELQDLKTIENFIKEKKHLPGVPSSKAIAENGINVAEMNAILLKKIEEMTLHMIQMQKQMEKQNKEIEQLKANQ